LQQYCKSVDAFSSTFPGFLDDIMELRLESGVKSARPNYDVTDGHEDNQYSSSTSDGEYSEFTTFELRKPRTIVERILVVLGMGIRQRRRADGVGLDPHAEGLLKKRSSPTREVRRGRRTYVVGWFLRAVLVLPMIVLSIL
jgi:hypothetical protein